MNKSLLPPSSTQLEKAIEQAMDRYDVQLQTVNNPLTAPAQFLPFLAWQFSVLELLDGLSEQEQRQLIFNAAEIFKHKGTTWAVEQSLNTIFEQSEVITFPHDSDRVFEFDVRVIAKPTLESIIDSDKFQSARTLVNRVKNVRSRFVNFKLEIPPAETQIKTQTGVALGLSFDNELALSANSDIESKMSAALALSFVNQLALSASTAKQVKTTMIWSLTFNTSGEIA